MINGRPLRELLVELAVTPQSVHGVRGMGFLSVADCPWPAEAASSLRRLAGTEARDEDTWPLGPGRLPLYVCPVCAELTCGALTVEVAWDVPGSRAIWSDLRVEDGFADHGDVIDLSTLGPFHFDAAAYREALLEPVGHLDTVAAAIAYRRARGLRSAVQRAFRR